MAEKNDTDETYPTGTIVKIGGAKEATADDGTNPIGVISESPAYLMNSDGPGQAIAFVGKVPIRVVGSIEKGGHVYAGPGGVGIGRPMAHDIGRLVGISLEENNKASEKLVQCVLKV